MPFAWYKQNQYLYNNYTYGRSSATTIAKPGDFYAVLLVVIAIGFVGGLVLGLLAAALSEHPVFVAVVALWLFSDVCVDLRRISSDVFFRGV